MVSLPTPKDRAYALSDEGFTEDQAKIIAAVVYQPLMQEVEALQKAVLRLIEHLTPQHINRVAARSIIEEITHPEEG